MRLRDHWKKVFWAYMDRSLPLLYGLGFVFLVVRRLPKEEYGLYALAFAFLMIALNLQKNFLFDGLIRYLAPKDAPTRSLVTASLAFAFVITLAFTVALLAFRMILEHIFDAPGFAAIVPLIVLVFVVYLLRDYCVTFLSVRIQSLRIFGVDLAYYGPVFVLLAVASFRGQLQTAADVFRINLIASLFSLAVGLALSSFYWRPELKLSRDAFRKLSNFGKYNFAAGVGFSLQGELDTIVLGAVLNPIAVATYSSGKIFFKFYNLQDQLLQQVGYPALCRAHSQEDPKLRLDLTEKMMAYSTMAIWVASALLLILAHPVMNWIYHGLYPEAPTVFSILVLGTFVTPMNTIASLSYAAADRLRTRVTMTFTHVALLAVATIVGVYGGQLYGVAVGVAVVPWIMVGFHWHQMRKFLPLTVTGIARRWGDVRALREILKSWRSTSSRQ
jgi:O-antigen/teichoic acid export membrane protein